MAFHEHVSRSLTKALTFRAVILTSDLIIIIAITHKFETALPIVIGTNLASTCLYYIHERAWNHVHWGKIIKKKPKGN